MIRKTFLHDIEITDSRFVRMLEEDRGRHFKQVSDGHYVICNGYFHPLLASISDNCAFVLMPFEREGSYTYNGKDEIRLHEGWGFFTTYRKITIFGLPFMVSTCLSDDDAILAAMTDKRFLHSLIRALA